MSAKEPKAPKKAGVNKGIEKGVDSDKFYDKVICKKCGKEIEFLLEGKFFQKCPRCNARVERNLKQEGKQAKRIIVLDILRRSKRAQLHFGFILTMISFAYSVTGFFTGIFTGNRWWLALLSLPFVVLAFFLMKGTRQKSASKKYKFYAWLALIINFVAFALIVVTAVPPLNTMLAEFLGM